MNVRKATLLLVVAGSLAVSASSFAGNSSGVCASVGTTATPILAAKADRASFSLWTTSGSATIYFNDAGNSPVSTADANSFPIPAGGSYTCDQGGCSVGAIKVVAKTGTVWVCAKQGAK